MAKLLDPFLPRTPDSYSVESLSYVPQKMGGQQLIGILELEMVQGTVNKIQSHP